MLGDKQIDFEFLSDQNVNFPDSFHRSVNYEDENLNVAIPVFSIHGNHDDLTGTDRLSSMDILSSTGLINYFGKWHDLTRVDITPIVIKKNETKVALYGLSHIHDARLARLFRDERVSFLKPDGIQDADIFHLMVLHQNRAERGRLNFLPEDKLPGFLDLVIWGHEHDCRIEPEPNPRTTVFFSQPGSSIATSLSEGESIEKHVGVLEIHKNNFKMVPVKLQTVRPFVFRSVNIEEHVERYRLNEGNVKDKIFKFYAKNIEEMIEEAKKKINDNVKQPKEALIRLRIVYTNEDFAINTTRFGQQFHNRVANPESILTFKKQVVKKPRTAEFVPDDAAMRSAFAKKEQQDCVEDVVESFFSELKGDDQLKVFNLKTLTEVCRLLVKNDEAGVQSVFDFHDMKAQEFLTEKACSKEEIANYLKDYQASKSLEALNDVTVSSNSSLFSAQSIKRSGDFVSPDAASTSALSTRGKTTRGRATTSSTRAAKSAENTSNTLNVRKTATTAKTKTQSSAQSKSQRSTTARKSAKTVYVDDSDSE